MNYMFNCAVSQKLGSAFIHVMRNNSSSSNGLKVKSMTNCMNTAELLFSRDSQLSETETRVLTETAPTQLSSELREAPKQGEGLLREYETS